MKHLFYQYIRYKIKRALFLVLFAGYGLSLGGDLTAQNFDVVDFHSYHPEMFQNIAYSTTNIALKDSSAQANKKEEDLHVQRADSEKSISLQSNEGLAWGAISNVSPK